MGRKKNEKSQRKLVEKVKTCFLFFLFCLCLLHVEMEQFFFCQLFEKLPEESCGNLHNLKLFVLTLWLSFVHFCFTFATSFCWLLSFFFSHLPVLRLYVWKLSFFRLLQKCCNFLFLLFGWALFTFVLWRNHLYWSKSCLRKKTIPCSTCKRQRQKRKNKKHVFVTKCSSVIKKLVPKKKGSMFKKSKFFFRLPVRAHSLFVLPEQKVRASARHFVHGRTLARGPFK